jgi:predicted secreted protein
MITHVDAPVSLRIVEAQAVDLPGPEVAEGSNGRLGIQGYRIWNFRALGRGSEVLPLGVM